MVIIIGDAATGAFSSHAPQTFQSGVAQCQLVALPSGMDTTGCTGTITFSKAFTSIPTKFGISTQCLANTAQTLTGKTADQVCQALGIQQGHALTAILSYLSFESDNGQMWVGMPAAKTEIYGTVNHEQIADLQGVTQAALSANILTVSTGASAVLRTEYLSQADGLWHELASTSGTLDLSINFLPGPATTTITTIAGGAQNVGQVLRVVGIGGGGVGDNPVFNNIVLAISANVPLSIIPSVGCQFGNGVCVSTTTMKFWVTAINPLNGVGNVEPIFSWWACTC